MAWGFGLGLYQTLEGRCSSLAYVGRSVLLFYIYRVGERIMHQSLMHSLLTESWQPKGFFPDNKQANNLLLLSFGKGTWHTYKGGRPLAFPISTGLRSIRITDCCQSLSALAVHSLSIPWKRENPTPIMWQNDAYGAFTWQLQPWKFLWWTTYYKMHSNSLQV